MIILYTVYTYIQYLNLIDFVLFWEDSLKKNTSWGGVTDGLVALDCSWFLTQIFELVVRPKDLFVRPFRKGFPMISPKITWPENEIETINSTNCLVLILRDYGHKVLQIILLGAGFSTFKDDISGHCFRKWGPTLHLLVASSVITPTSRIITLYLPIYFRSFIGALFQPTYHHHRGPLCRRWSHHSRLYSVKKKHTLQQTASFLLKIGDPESKLAVSTFPNCPCTDDLPTWTHGEKVATWTRREMQGGKYSPYHGTSGIDFRAIGAGASCDSLGFYNVFLPVVWTNPQEKYAQVKLGEHKKNMCNHQLVFTNMMRWNPSAGIQETKSWTLVEQILGWLKFWH